MVEFCYIANTLLCIYLALDILGKYKNPNLFSIIYGLASGPLIMGIIVNGDRMYFHSPKHLISVFIHLDPALLTWMIRWKEYDTILLADLSYIGVTTTIKNLLTLATPIYEIWFVCYYIIIFIIKKKKIETKNYRTAFRDIMKSKKYKRLLTDFPLINEIIFMLCHAVGAMVAISFAGVMFNNWYLNTVVMFVIFSITSWNASYKYTKLIYEYDTNIDTKTS